LRGVSKEMKTLLPVGAAALGMGGVALLGHSVLAWVLIGACMLLAGGLVFQYIATIGGHDPWRALRRERRYRRGRR
jgi:hypothetical protein